MRLCLDPDFLCIFAPANRALCGLTMFIESICLVSSSEISPKYSEDIKPMPFLFFVCAYNGHRIRVNLFSL